MKKHIFWLDDYTILYKDGSYLDFIPRETMTRVEQLNAISRFTLYYIILIFLFNNDEQNAYMGILVLIFIVLLYYTYISDIEGKKKDEMKRVAKYKNTENIEHMANILNEPTELNYGHINNNYSNTDNNIVIESGYYDSDNNLVIGPKYTPPKYIRHKKPDYSYEDYEQYRKNTCRKPTIDNPYMNPAVTDFGNGDIPEACNADDENINEEITRTFNDNLFRDVDAVWERENSQRQFYTMPTTSVPPNTVEFANFLYGQTSTCKEDNALCMKNIYEDLRYKR